LTPEKPVRDDGFGASEDHDFYVGLGLAVQAVRKERGLSRKALALRSGVSYPYLAELETGRKRMSARALLLVSRGLRVRPYQLLEEAERWQSGEPVTPDAARQHSEVMADLQDVLSRLGLDELLAIQLIANRLDR
jgi:transcriptional regulator with XRE-family HTH domain